MSELLLRHGEWDVIDPKSASWQYLSFRVERLRGDDHVSRNTGGEEVALLRRSHLDLGEDREPPLRLPLPDRVLDAHTGASAWEASLNSLSFSVARPESIVSCAFAMPSSGVAAAPAT